MDLVLINDGLKYKLWEIMLTIESKTESKVRSRMVNPAAPRLIYILVPLLNARWI